MNLFADENIDRCIVEALRRKGHNVQYVMEMMPGVNDETVLRTANDTGAILLTADKDFGELIFRLGRAHQGVVLLRLEGMAPEEKATVVVDAVAAHGQELAGAFSVLAPRRFRVRQMVRWSDAREDSQG